MNTLNLARRLNQAAAGRLLRWLLPGATLLVACGDTNVTADLGPGDPTGTGDGTSLCVIPVDQLFDGGPGKDGIPALTNPTLVPVGDPQAEYLSNQARVIGVEIGGEVIAIPHNVGWWHEIVNLDVGGRQIAVTYCPLTGSGIAFDRSDVGGAEFGVSGLLFQNNLVMYNRRTEESLWPQMLRQGACGPSASAQLSLYPVVEMTWEGWHTLHPETTVIGEPARSTTHNTYPYGNYEELNNSNTLCSPCRWA